jgi:predicted ATPase
MTASDVSVEAIRAEVQRALIDLFEAVSDERPLLLLIDDAHHLDSVSASVIRALCGRTNTARLLVLVCVRRSHAHMPLLMPARRTISCLLEPLSPDESRQVIVDVGGPQMRESHVTWCLTQAGGNPFWVFSQLSG